MLIFDTSTLILLVKTDLLRKVLEEFTGVITRSVRKEATYKDSLDARIIIQYITEKRLLLNPDPPGSQVKKILKDFSLGKGEATSLLLAKEKKAVYLMKDVLPAVQHIEASRNTVSDVWQKLHNAGFLYKRLRSDSTRLSIDFSTTLDNISNSWRRFYTFYTR